MNDIVDKLLIRILFAFFICFLLFIYKYAHFILYPSVKRQLFAKNFYPSANASDTLHLFARIVGVGILLSGLKINESDGLTLTGLNFLVWGSLSFTLYLLSLYILDSIVFYKVTYEDEILKKSNLSYALIAGCNAIALALIMQKILIVAPNDLEKTIIYWLFSLVLIAGLLKLHKFSSRFPFESYVRQESMGISVSYSGYLLGVTVILLTAMEQKIPQIEIYCVHIFTKILLSILLFPIFKWGIATVFRLREVGKKEAATYEKAHRSSEEIQRSLLGEGMYEGGLYLSSALTISVVVSHIEFGTIYPLF